MLERIQKRFTRMIPSLRKLSYDNRLKELKLWPLEDRRKRADLIEVYKMTRGLSVVDFNKFFYTGSTFLYRWTQLEIKENSM